MVSTHSTYNRLKAFSQNEKVISELLNYSRNAFTDSGKAIVLRDFGQEPQTADWERYVEESKTSGVYAVLRKYLVQFQFPILDNISKSEDYRAATLKGKATDNMPLASGLKLVQPDKLRLFIHASLAGKIPVIIANNRDDFQAIIRALTYKNEPKAIPDSMGAAMIKGFNNWDRLRAFRKNWTQHNPGSSLSMTVLMEHKAFFQDKVIVLSRIPYSNIPAEQLDLGTEEWLEHSLKIRLEHECAHYFTLRYFGCMANNMHDEIIADYIGIISVQGQFEADWFLRFVGLEHYPTFRIGGRMQNYLGQPAISEAAFTSLQKIMVHAARNIERFDKKLGQAFSLAERQSRLLSLCSRNLVEMASNDGVELLLTSFRQLQISEYSHGN